MAAFSKQTGGEDANRKGEEMSMLYSVVETICYGLNKIPGGGVKGAMNRALTTSTGKEKLPAWVSRRCCVREESLQGFPVYILRHEDESRRTSRVVLFLAGGGGMSRPTILHYDTVTRIVKNTGATVYIPFYPLAPEHNVSEALVWLTELYGEMRKHHLLKDIVFAGDSAGANLCLSLTARIAEKPRRLILISPAFGIQNGEPRNVRLRMEKTDPLLSVAMNDCICENWGRGIPLESPDISPEFIDYTGFPEMLFFYGSHELFYPHVRNGLKKIRVQGAVVTDIEKPMCHDWALCHFFREGREALTQMCDYIRE